MTITKDIQKYIDQSVLCWLATVDATGQPNVSPKEIFASFGSDTIIIANIASPQTVDNIQKQSKVCISFIDVLVQKGYQLKGNARIVERTDVHFKEMEHVLLEMTGGHFPFATITEISISAARPIIAPKYLLHPETTEDEQIESAKKNYGLHSQ